MQKNKFNKLLARCCVAAGLITVLSCTTTSSVNEIYDSKTFTIYKDRVVQGDNEAIVKSPVHIVSDYQSTAGQIFPREVSFKFSINEKDIEMKPGLNHQIIIGSEHESPVIKFGGQNISGTATNDKYLPQNYEYTFRVDMSYVIKQFDEKGYYTAYDGSKIAKKDFKGFYIAGNAEPLSWDFSNLGNKGLKLEDSDGDNIYEITVVLNPTDEDAAEVKQWKLERDISGKPSYTSGQPLVDALYNMATEEALINIEADSTFRTGAKWGGVWTRDISYSILLAFAYHQPDVAKISLMKKVNRNRIIQDTGSGGAWPVSSDRTTWALAAWEVYKTTGDEVWLKSSYTIIKNTLDDDYKTLYNPQTGMYRGESSFLDWREQTYPKWMSNMDIYVSENLGTNAVHYQAHKILSAMGKILGKDVSVYEQRAERIKKGINEYLWQEDKGYYAQYLYGRTHLNVSPRFEALGEALAILFDVADEGQAKEIISRSPVTEYGTTCIYPQIPGIPPYHNNGIWPFVQAYWNIAAAKAGNEAVLNHGLAAIYRAGGLFLTNYENFVADNGDYVGTEVNSHRMLWSMAGNIAMVHRVFMGMDFTEKGIVFQPAVPQGYDGTKQLKNFTYRGAVLDITVKGFGNQVKSFSVDGVEQKEYFIPNTISGKHTIEIIMANNSFGNKINLVENHFSVTTPQVIREGNKLVWESVKGAKEYILYTNGRRSVTTGTTSHTITQNGVASYKISAVDDKGYEGFTSEPILVYPEANVQIVEIEDFAPKSGKEYINFSGKGFTEVTTTQNKKITLKVNVQREGEYLIDFRYANGSGPWNTDNKCAIRSLYTNKNYTGVVVMAQRGTDEWSDWGNTNSHKVQLNKGENILEVVFEDWNNNMNVEVNTAVIDYCRIIKL